MRSLVIMLWVLAAAPLSAAPLIHCEAPELNFGLKMDTETVEHRFLIENRGDEPLVISSVKACCGATIAGGIGTLPPGGNTRISITLRLRGRTGSFNKSIYVASNDSRRPYYRLTLRGAVKQMVQAIPAVVLSELVTIPKVIQIAGASSPEAGRQQVTRYLIVRSSHGRTFKINDIDGPQGLTFSVSELSPSSYRVKLIFSLAAPFADVPKITLHTDLNGGRSVAVPVEIVDL